MIKKFLNVKIDVSKYYVIPREETAFWVEKAIKEIKRHSNYSSGIKALDIFSGTGCMGIAVLKNIENSVVDFGDIDSKALSQIKTNLKLNNIAKKRAGIIKTDIFSNIKWKYDLIVANPPYVAEERINEVQPSVKKYEPKRAWLAGKKGMAVIQKFLEKAKGRLKNKGVMYFEFDPFQKSDIEVILIKEDFNFKFLKDQFGKIRYAKIRRD